MWETRGHVCRNRGGISPYTACTSLENLNLCKNMFRAAGAASLAHVLPQCTAITNLDLSGSYITYYNYYQHILFIFSTSFFFAPVPSHTCYPSALYSRTSIYPVITSETLEQKQSCTNKQNVLLTDNEFKLFNG